MRWFHIRYFNTPEVEYDKYANDTKKLWWCDRVDCERDYGNPFSVLYSQMNIMLEKVSQG